MQVCCVDPQPPELPPSDIEKMKSELAQMDMRLREMSSGTAAAKTYEDLKTSVTIIDGIILSLDNSNDFVKIGGLQRLKPVLMCSDAELVAATSELIADLVQNNTFCQSAVLNHGILSELVKLLDTSSNFSICSKALYAISCLSRHNEESVKQLKSTNISSILMKILEKPDEKLRAKTAFFLSYLSDYEEFREDFYEKDLIGVLIKLIKEEQDSSSEHLLSALESQVLKHIQSRVQCSSKEYNLQDVMLDKIKLYDSKEEFNEAIEHCRKILSLCFPETKFSVS